MSFQLLFPQHGVENNSHREWLPCRCSKGTVFLVSLSACHFFPLCKVSGSQAVPRTGVSGNTRDKHVWIWAVGGGTTFSDSTLNTHRKHMLYQCDFYYNIRKLYHGSCLPMAALSSWSCLSMAVLSAWSSLPIAVLSSMYAREGHLASSARTKHALAPGH